MHAPAPIARGLKDPDDTRDLSDQDLSERTRRCQEEQSRRLAEARAQRADVEPLQKTR